MNIENIYLNPEYSFNTFIVRLGNRFAHASALAVAEAPTKAYNPLLIFGGKKQERTHLMQAIAHYVSQNNHISKVLYVTAETFCNDFINSISGNAIDEFRIKYRSIDLLVIEDIQSLLGNDQAIEEFLHTINALYDDNKQIVISSDRPPRELPMLKESLWSRFELGLIADIQPLCVEPQYSI